MASIFNFSHPQHSKAHRKMKSISILFLFLFAHFHGGAICVSRNQSENWLNNKNEMKIMKIAARARLESERKWKSIHDELLAVYIKAWCMCFHSLH
jgi:hypothetical protein